MQRFIGGPLKKPIKTLIANDKVVNLADYQIPVNAVEPVEIAA